jgi:hypothetical protein
MEANIVSSNINTTKFLVTIRYKGDWGQKQNSLESSKCVRLLYETWMFRQLDKCYPLKSKLEYMNGMNRPWNLNSKLRNRELRWGNANDDEVINEREVDSVRRQNSTHWNP